MIYLDNAATTKPLSAALEKAARFNGDNFFNPSALYRGGLENSKEISVARDFILNSLSLSRDYECIFTSCGSESDNQAIFSCAKRGVAVTTAGEHAAVYKSFAELKNRGVETKFAPLEKNGSVNVGALLDIVKEGNVRFVSVVHVNNETGAVNDVNAIADAVKSADKNIVFHSDGVQAFGKLPFRLSPQIDLYSVSAHKINALKGTGALIKRKNISLAPLIFGGGQESGLRSGTENIFGIKVFEYAAREKFEHIGEYYDKVRALNRRAKEALDPRLFDFISDETCSPYILCVSAKGVKGEVILHMLEEFGVIVGNGSACSSKNRFSRVIEACGYKNNDGVIRLSFNPYLTEEEVDFAAEKLNECAAKLAKVMRR
ncbi:MAG: cysteine desulfurase NifS [Bacillota bacterium]|nr:MAG: cysteine desulfurase NifS [Bacillota bacterium]